MNTENYVFIDFNTLVYFITLIEGKRCKRAFCFILHGNVSKGDETKTLWSFKCIVYCRVELYDDRIYLKTAVSYRLTHSRFKTEWQGYRYKCDV